jgi:4-amino-4-deoxy-L-arabinose transferase-like glycosyltransferase
VIGPTERSWFNHRRKITGMVQGKLAGLGKGHYPFLLLLLVYVFLATHLTLSFPPFSGPNEVLHYEYIALMRQTGRLPDLATSFRADERHQPPVYYSLATLLSLPFPTPPLDNTFQPNSHYITTQRGNLNPYIHLPPAAVATIRAGRMASLLFGLLALVAIYGAAQLTLPRTVSLLIVSLVAFQPTFLQLSSTISNDLAVTAVATLLVAYTSYLIVRQKTGRAFLLWGVLLAMTLLTKASGIFLILLLPLALWPVWRQQKRLTPVLQSGLWSGLGFLPLYGSWLLFNHIRSGDALGLAPSVPIRALFTLRPADFQLTIPHIPELFRSFWLDWSPGVFGYGPDWFYGLVALLLLVALAGWLRRETALSQPASIVLLHLLWVGALGAAFVSVKTLMIRDVGFLVPEGRWLLPAWPSLAWLVGVGWAKWWPMTGRSWAYGVGVKTAVYPLTALFLLIFWLPQLYPQAVRLTSLDQIPATATLTHLLYDDHMALVALEADQFTIDRPTVATLYWHSRQKPKKDYTVSAQLLWSQDGAWHKLAEQSSLPGSGLNSTLSWQADEIYRDQIIIQPQGTLYGPTQAVLGIWLTNGETASIQYQDRPADWPFAAEVEIRPSVPIPLPPQQLDVPVYFDDLFVLQALDINQADLEGQVTLWWQAQQEIADSFTIFVHLIDEEGRLVSQSDKIPANGSSPTSIWQPGDVIRDEHRLGPFPAAGSLLIGAYEPNTGERLPVTRQGLPQTDNVWQYAFTSGQ